MNTEKKQLLTKEIIMKKFLGGNHLFLIGSIPFVLVGIYMLIAKMDPSNITEVIMFRTTGLALIIIPIFVIINTQKKYKDLMTNANYVVTIDALKDKEIESDHLATDMAKKWRHYLFFKDYFKKYGKRIRVTQQEYLKAKIDDTYYLAFLPKHTPVIFKKDDYELVETNKLIKSDELSNYIDVKKIDTKKAKGTTNIDKEQIIKDIKKAEQPSLLVSILTTIATIGISIFVYFTEKSFFIFPVLLAILLLCVVIYKVAKTLFITTKLKKDDFNIKTDTVIAIDKNIKFKESHEYISFTFKNFDNTVKAKREDFSEVAVDDELYLVFVKGITLPIRVYQVKHSTVSNKNKLN